jgi:hypothetical protein
VGWHPIPHLATGFQAARLDRRDVGVAFGLIVHLRRGRGVWLAVDLVTRARRAATCADSSCCQ